MSGAVGREREEMAVGVGVGGDGGEGVALLAKGLLKVPERLRLAVGADGDEVMVEAGDMAGEEVGGEGRAGDVDEVVARGSAQQPGIA